MALIRLAYAADLPLARRGPAQARRDAGRRAPRRRAAGARPRLLGGGARRSRRRPRRPPAAAPAPAPAAAPRLARFEDVVALARAKRDIQLQAALENDVRLARFEPGRIAFSLIEGASPQSRRRCRDARSNGRASAGWSRLSQAPTAPTLREAAKRARRPSA